VLIPHPESLTKCLKPCRFSHRSLSQFNFFPGNRKRSWMRHYATSRNVACSISYEVRGFFSCPNPSSSILVLRSTRLLTEMSTRGEMGGRRVRMTTSPPSVRRPSSHSPRGPQGLLWDSLTFLHAIIQHPEDSCEESHETLINEANNSFTFLLIYIYIYI
jgi:hypothetical protein